MPFHIRKSVILATAALTLTLLVVISEYPTNAHAAGGKTSVEEVVTAARHAWGTLSDFLKEVWHDVLRIAPSFLNGVPNDIEKIVTTIRGLIDTFVPTRLTHAIAAIVNFFLQLFQFLLDLIKNLFIRLISQSA